MIGKPSGKEEVDAALALAFSGAAMVRIASGALSNPVSGSREESKG
jgi:hypothetical protein